MTNRIYTTSNGKSIDFGAIQLKNEETRAVGNMGVNARGDKIEGKKIVKTRNNLIQTQNKRQMKMSNSVPLASIPEYNRIIANNLPEINDIQDQDLTVISIEDQITAGDLITADVQAVEEFEPDVAVTSEDVATLTGLAAALAKTKELKK